MSTSIGMPIFSSLDLKSENTKYFTGQAGKLKEDKLTFMRFYNMKKQFFPSKVQVYTYPHQELDSWRPSARDYPVMTYVRSFENEHKLMIYGGINNEPINEIVQIKIRDEDASTQWQKLLKSDVKMNSDNDFGRYGESQVSFQEQISPDSDSLSTVIYYYGGGNMYNKRTEMRECINQIIRYIPSTGEFETVKESGVVHQSRRLHSACSFGKYMIVHGGINSQGQILDDVI